LASEAEAVAAGPVSEQEWAELRREALFSLPDTLRGRPDVLLPYQAAAFEILDRPETAVLVIEKSRRIGLTWGLAAYAVLKAARQKSARGMDAMYISYSQEMTREFIDACAMWARAFALAAGAVDETVFDDSDAEGERSIKAFRIQFASGFEVLALSSAPRTLRGKQGLVIVDEAAFVDSLKELLKAALAFLMWGGQVVICSTHDGVDNAFNELVQDVLSGELPYDHLKIDFDQALLDGLYQRICLVTGKEWSPGAEATWRQSIIKFYGSGADEELFCVASQGSGTWLPGPLIEARMTSDAPVLEWELPANFLALKDAERDALTKAFLFDLDEALAGLDRGEQHAVGFDFARYVDLSVLTLLAIDKVMRRRVRLVVEMRRVPYDEQGAVAIRSIRKAPRFLGGAFDATGAGLQVAERAQREISLTAIAAIKLSQEWYRTEMPPLKQAFEDGAISIPKNREHLSDLRLVKVIRGIPMVPDLRTGGEGVRRHGDFAISLALAYHATRMRFEEYAYRPAVSAQTHASITSRSRPDDFDDDYRDPLGRGPLGARIRGGVF
jgi:phage FluMu gp28-like protein